MIESCESVGDNLERLRFLAHTHNITGLYSVGCNVHYLTVDGDMAVEHKLTGCCAGGSDAKTVNHVVEAAFQKLEENLTGDTLGAGCLVEEIAELLLENAVGVFCLLLLTELNSVLRRFAATVLTVLAGGKFFRASTLSSPKMGSPNLRAILVFGPVYLAILSFS